MKVDGALAEMEHSMASSWRSMDIGTITGLCAWLSGFRFQKDWRDNNGLGRLVQVMMARPSKWNRPAAIVPKTIEKAFMTCAVKICGLMSPTLLTPP